MSQGLVVPYSGKGSWFDAQEMEVIRDLLMSDAHLGATEQGSLFEADMARYLGVPHAIAVSSCSMALELVMRVLRLGPGDEVITSPLTYEASIWGLLEHGCAVTFCDIDPETLCLSARDLEAAVTSRTKAIFTTHYGGLMADMDQLPVDLRPPWPRPGRGLRPCRRGNVPGPRRRVDRRLRLL